MRAAVPNGAAIELATETPRRARAEVARDSTKRSVSWIDAMTLGAIGLVVVLVSLPRLRRFALRENETDALRTLRLLSSELAAVAPDGTRPQLSRIVASRPDAKRLLTDLESLSDGRMRRHGYLFDVVLDRSGEPVLCAWPWDEGHTGQGAFVFTERRGLLGHANTDGAWTGPSRPLTAAALESHNDWRSMARF